jgi:transcriptional regulator with XRE-family HTH domain
MDHAGQKLKRAREQLKLTYRQVEQASQQIASRRGSEEFAVPLSRLADIENKGTVPSIYRIYTLCAVYRLDMEEVLRWYGVPGEHLAAESLHMELPVTHLLRFRNAAQVTVPQPSTAPIDLDRTTYLSEFIRRWGKMPFTFLNGLETREYRYGWIGLEDWSMYPILHPGAVVAIDESRRKIAAGGWTNEFDRPIYFLESRDGHRVGWCTLTGNRLILEPHPSSQQPAASYTFHSEIDVVGQVIGLAMLLEPRMRRSSRSGPPADATLRGAR